MTSTQKWKIGSMDIGQNIRARRKQLKMTLEQLALEIGSDTGNLSRIERGQQSVTTDKISLIAKALNCLPVDLMSSPSTKDISLPSGYMRVPLLNNQQVMNWNTLKNHIDFLDTEWLITDVRISTDSFSFEIQDSSMSPDFQNGDRIILDPSMSAEAGDFVLATNFHGVFFRKYRARGVIDGHPSFELYPLNEDFEIFHSSNSELKILGVMVEHRKYRKK